MRIFVSVSAKKEVTRESVEVAVKKYFKKFKHYDSDHWSILYHCVLLCRNYAGRTNLQTAKEALNEISEKVSNSSAAGIVPDYDNVDPKYLKLGQQAFKRLKQIVAEQKLNGGSLHEWELALDLSQACKKLLDNVDPVTDLSKYQGVVDTLNNAGIKV